MSKMNTRSVPDFSELLEDVSDAITGRYSSHVAPKIWEILFREIPAAHLKLQIKDRGASLNTEDEHTKVVIQVGQTIKYLADKGELSDFVDIEKLKRDGEQT